MLNEIQGDKATFALHLKKKGYQVSLSANYLEFSVTPCRINSCFFIFFFVILQKLKKTARTLDRALSNPGGLELCDP